jgi:hypothetical protein
VDCRDREAGLVVVCKTQHSRVAVSSLTGSREDPNILPNIPLALTRMLCCSQSIYANSNYSTPLTLCPSSPELCLLLVDLPSEIVAIFSPLLLLLISALLDFSHSPSSLPFFLSGTEP